MGLFLALTITIICLYIWSGWFSGVKIKGILHTTSASVSDVDVDQKLVMPAKELSKGASVSTLNEDLSGASGEASSGSSTDTSAGTQTNSCINHYSKEKRTTYFLTAVIFLLSMSFFVFAQSIVSLVNVLVLLPLLIALLLFLFPVQPVSWDRPGFAMEIFLSAILRPFIALSELAVPFQMLKQKKASTEKNSQKKAVIRAVGLGLLIALPLLFILGRILSSADAVFASYVAHLTGFLPDLALNTLMTQLLVTVLLTPFAFSFVMSGVKGIVLYLPADRKKETSADSSDDIAGQADKSTNSDAGPVSHHRKITVVTILFLVDLLYLFFAIIQFRYLTGAFQAVLPDGMTYAEYARSGFFELLAICVLNIFLLIGLGRRFDRAGRLGIWLRVLIHGLIAGSLVQWFSAIFRMRLYVDTFHLSQLRYFATALMLLLLVWFAFFLVAEWRVKIRITRWLIISALCALVLVNFSNPDYQIAKYNVNIYLQAELEGKPRGLDFGYLTTLSDEALPAIAKLKLAHDDTIIDQMERYLKQRELELIEENEEENWLSLNLVDFRARQAIQQATHRP